MIWPREQGGIVPPAPVHEGCTVEIFDCDNEGRCSVCGRKTETSIYVRHSDGMHAEKWLCKLHLSFEVAAKLVLDMKAQAAPGMPAWFGTEEDARGRAIVEGDDLIVVHEGDDEYFSALKNRITGGS